MALTTVTWFSDRVLFIRESTSQAQFSVCRPALAAPATSSSLRCHITKTCSTISLGTEQLPLLAFFKRFHMQRLSFKPDIWDRVWMFYFLFYPIILKFPSHFSFQSCLLHWSLKESLISKKTTTLLRIIPLVPEPTSLIPLPFLFTFSICRQLLCPLL